jgi:uncharacterized protein (TIGR00375 family)
MNSYFMDLHIHIGRTEAGQPVKISGSRNLTFYNIAFEASERKGLDMIGIIDCHSPNVQAEIKHYLESGVMIELEGGGIKFGKTTVILGSEIEVHDQGLGPAHLLAYLPTLHAMEDFTAWMKPRMTNIELSSQRIYAAAREVQAEVVSRGGILIPAHIFTPYKSIYGSCCNQMSQLLELDHVAAVELGLSADREMAGLISELAPFTFVTNSDAHSLSKIAREYNQCQMLKPDFSELVQALNRENGRCITANYGLNPRLGKYHRTFCSNCDTVLDAEEHIVERCSFCGSSKVVRGVMDRIHKIADRSEPVIPDYRPPYHYQVPLEFIPGIGPKTLQRLLDRFGTEMNILHHVTSTELIDAAGETIAALILAARTGTLGMLAGGGGIYGKILRG